MTLELEGRFHDRIEVPIEPQGSGWSFDHRDGGAIGFSVAGSITPGSNGAALDLNRLWVRGVNLGSQTTTLPVFKLYEAETARALRRRRWSPSPEQREDLIQQVALEAIERTRQHEIRRVAENVVQRHTSRHRRRKSLEPQSHHAVLEPESWLTTRLDLERLLATTTPTLDRSAQALLHTGGDCAEAARLLGLSPSTLRSHRHRLIAARTPQDSPSPHRTP